MVEKMKYLILENIRSAYNVGAIFRTADGAGVGKIFLVGYTPQPTDRFGREQNEIEKTSLGAAKTVPWEYVETGKEAIKKCQAEGFMVAAVEQTKKSVPLKDFSPPEKVVYILGNEVKGVEEKTIALSDVVVELPMLGDKESLNVSVAAGIIMYRDLV